MILLFSPIKKCWIVSACLLLASSSFPTVHLNHDSAVANLEHRLSQVADWIYAQYNQTLKLVRDSPSTANKTYWLLSANLFSSVALRYYYPEISLAIYLQLLSTLKWGYTRNNLHEAVVGDSIPFPIQGNRKIIVHQTSDYNMTTDMFDNSSWTYTDWKEYFDFPLYLALSDFWMGNRTGAVELFNEAYSMWNGIGIMDKYTMNTSRYATYKLALLLYASRIIGIPLADKEQIEKQLWSMQQLNETSRDIYGGIATEYNLDGTANTTESNTETAPLVIIAYKYTPNLMPTKLIWLYVSLGVLSISALIILIFLIPKMRKYNLDKKRKG